MRFKKAILIFLLISSVLNANEKIIVGIAKYSYAPYLIFEDEDIKGVFPDVFDIFCKTNNYDYEYEVLPLQRANYSYYFQNTKNDLRYPDHPYWNSDFKDNLEIIYSEFSLPCKEGVIVLEENYDKYSKLDTIATFRGFTISPYIKEIKSGEIELYEVNSIESLLTMLIHKRLKFIYMNYDIAKYYVNKFYPDAKIKMDENFKTDATFYYLSTINNPKLLKEFDLFIKNNQEILDKTKEKYGLK